MYKYKQFLFLKEVQNISVNFFLSEDWRMKDKMGVNKN